MGEIFWKVAASEVGSSEAWTSVLVVELVMQCGVLVVEWVKPCGDLVQISEYQASNSLRGCHWLQEKCS